MESPVGEDIPAASAFEEALRNWLLEADRLEEQPEQLLHGLVDQFARQGIHLLTSSALVRTLHPQFEMLAQRWRPFVVEEIKTEGTERLIGHRKVPGQRGVVDVYLFAHGHSQEALYQKSPFKAVHDAGHTLRWRLGMEEADLRFEVMDELKARGATDYLVLPIAMQAPFAAGVSFATAHADGFPAGFQQDLERLVPLFGLVMSFSLERISLREILMAYLGPTAAKRVLRGQIVLGQVQSLRAVIGFADLYGLRRHVDDVPEEDQMKALSLFFAVAQSTVRAAGGEILKMMGDSLLFVVPLEEGVPERIRARSLDVAQDVVRRSRRNKLLQRYGLTVSLGLHEGEVLLGNVGAPSRLDFTVLGEAVNLAARLQNWGGVHGEPIVLSSELAGKIDRNFRQLGTLELKGVLEPQEALAPHE